VAAHAGKLLADVIAEGVETDEQQQFIESVGCTPYQSYLFCKPLQIEELESMFYQN
jgi:EAL domain-containing protein (putative c-di-GMP-specific phosphodiesterase class I)